MDWGSVIRMKTLEEADLWRNRYRVLFEQNVAGIILTKVEGHIVDCNEPCARMFGFDSRDEMLAYSAWDFYFDRAEREILLDRLRTQRNCPAEEVRLRGRNGAPVWVLATRTVVSFEYGVPELLQGTFIDITVHKTAQAWMGDTKYAESPARMPEGENARMADLSQRLATLLRRASQTLQPENLPRIGKPEIHEFWLVLEEIKMLMSELELLRFFRQ
jgi:PAS domain S-box-containing protein